MKLFNRGLDYLVIILIGMVFLSMTHLEYKIVYATGYVLCTMFWKRHVQMTRFETYTVGLVWPMAMIHFGFMVLFHRLAKGKWTFHFTTLRYAAEPK